MDKIQEQCTYLAGLLAGYYYDAMPEFKKGTPGSLSDGRFDAVQHAAVTWALAGIEKVKADDSHLYLYVRDPGRLLVLERVQLPLAYLTYPIKYQYDWKPVIWTLLNDKMKGKYGLELRIREYGASDMENDLVDAWKWFTPYLESIIDSDNVAYGTAMEQLAEIFPKPKE